MRTSPRHGCAEGGRGLNLRAQSAATDFLVFWEGVVGGRRGGSRHEYGYEFWIAVGPHAEPPEGIGLKDFSGGLYAVTSCPLGAGSDVAQRWKALLRWVHTSRYTWRRTTHELEKARDVLAAPDETVLELYLPLEE